MHIEDQLRKLHSDAVASLTEALADLKASGESDAIKARSVRVSSVSHMTTLADGEIFPEWQIEIDNASPTAKIGTMMYDKLNARGWAGESYEVRCVW
jgi:hypothetical protein